MRINSLVQILYFSAAAAKNMCTAGGKERQCRESMPDIGFRNDFTERERGILRGVWPMALLENPSKQARVVHTSEEFLREVLVGEHLNDLVVFPNGIHALNLSWEETVPGDLQSFLESFKHGGDIVQGLLDQPEIFRRYDWRMELYNHPGRDIFESTDSHEEQLFIKRLREVLIEISNGTLKPQDVYFAETSFRDLYPHPIGGDITAAIFSRDVKDLLGSYAPWNFYWDRQMAGLFVGGRFSGTGLHVDRQLWSDVGRNFHGHKLIAVWPPGRIGADALKEFQEDLFLPPLDAQRVETLRKAVKITLLRPGDMYLLSGGVAHSALCVSDDSMCVGAYESAVTLHPKHVQLWNTKGMPKVQCDKIHCLGETPGLDEKQAVIAEGIRNLETVALQLHRGGPKRTLVDRLGPVPASWNDFIENLHSDEHLQAKLQAHFVEVVDFLMAQGYTRKRIPKSVLVAAGLDAHNMREHASNESSIHNHDVSQSADEKDFSDSNDDDEEQYELDDQHEDEFDDDYLGQDEYASHLEGDNVFDDVDGENGDDIDASLGS